MRGGTRRLVDWRRSLTLIMVGLFTVGYFAATCSLASLGPFSFDELTTYNIARLPTAGDVWRAWLESGDGLPPVTHVVTHLVGSAFGFSHVAARMPGMVGFWLMCLGIFVFLRRRVCPTLAWVGMLLPVTALPVYAYAYQARGYGMVLAFASAAVVCWDLAHDRRWRFVALLGLPISLAAAIATHAYAVLVVVPLALAELTRTMERRRVDWFVWMGLVAVGFLFLPANPVLSHIRHLPEVARYTVRRDVSVFELTTLWGQFLSFGVTYFGLLAFVCLSWARAPQTDNPPSLTTREGQPSAAAWVLAIGLTALPAIGWVFANLITGLLLFRYVIATVIGFSLAIPLLCRVAITNRPQIALLLAAWVTLSAAWGIMTTRHAMLTTSVTTASIAGGQGCFRLLRLWTRLPADGLPIVVSDFNVFNQLHHYAPEPLKQRLVFLVDPEFGRLMAPYTPFYVRVFGQRREPLEEFLRSNPAFYLYDCGGSLPLLPMLVKAGVLVRDNGFVDTPQGRRLRDLYRVSVPGGSSENVGRRWPSAEER